MNKYKFIAENGFIHQVETKLVGSLSYEEFAKKVLSEKFEMETKQLPVNCIKYTITDKIERYIQYIPEDNYRLNYKGKLYVIRLPNTILIFEFKKNTLTKNCNPIMLWTEDRNIDLEKSEFFIPKLHNIYPDGHICEGVPTNGNTQREYINQYMTNLFTTEYNDDLNSGKRIMPNVSKDQHKLLPHLDDPADLHDLIKCWWSPLNESDGEFSFGAPVSGITKRKLRNGTW